ncbi:MAG: DUF4149 domain-containing protein [Ramlibacter sp.]
MNDPGSPPPPAWKERLAVFAAALWWGSLSVTGFLAVPTLFASLPTPALAGNVAARLFSAQGWVAIACGVVLLLASRTGDGRSGLDWRGGAVLFVLAGLLLAVLSEFAVAPRIMARENLRLWHGLGTAMYGLQWLCAGVVLWKVSTVRET